MSVGPACIMPTKLTLMYGASARAYSSRYTSCWVTGQAAATDLGGPGQAGVARRRRACAARRCRRRAGPPSRPAAAVGRGRAPRSRARPGPRPGTPRRRRCSAGPRSPLIGTAAPTRPAPPQGRPSRIVRGSTSTISISVGSSYRASRAEAWARSSSTVIARPGRNSTSELGRGIRDQHRSAVLVAPDAGSTKAARSSGSPAMSGRCSAAMSSMVRATPRSGLMATTQPPARSTPRRNPTSAGRLRKRIPTAAPGTRICSATQSMVEARAPQLRQLPLNSITGADGSIDTTAPIKGAKTGGVLGHRHFGGRASTGLFLRSGPLRITWRPHRSPR